MAQAVCTIERDSDLRPVFHLIVSEQSFIVAEQNATLFGSDDDPNGHDGCFEARTDIQSCSLFLTAHMCKEANWRADQHSGFFESLYRSNTPIDRGGSKQKANVKQPEIKRSKEMKSKFRIEYSYTASQKDTNAHVTRRKLRCSTLTLPFESSWFRTPLCKKGLALPRRKRLMGPNVTFFELFIRHVFSCKTPSPPVGLPISSVTLQVKLQFQFGGASQYVS